MKLNKLFIVFVLLGAVILTGCSRKTKVDELIDSGKIVTVRYNANGGTYLDREGITLIDMFNPNDYTKDSNGKVHIKLINPTDPSRPAGGSEGIYITKTSHFLVGWYKNCTIRKNAEGKVVDDAGNVLVEKNNKYYLESDMETVGTPAYDYSGYWDFENDTIEYSSDMGRYELNLYACWSTYFKFEYLAKDESGNWKNIGETTFDYMTTNALDSKSSDYDTIWVPDWNDGAMQYTHKYMNNATYTFPKVSGKTFKAAYTDENCTNEILGSYEHQGTIDKTTGKAVGQVEKIYCIYEDGEKYHISNASQLVAHANLNGIYEIEADLDFAGLNWPTSLAMGTFTGQIFGKDGNTYSFKNISVKHNSDTAKFGGVFGAISSNAVVKNINFENVVVDLAYVGTRNRNTNFGLLAGMIEDGANIDSVSINGTLRVGVVTLGDGYSINLIANGDVSNVSAGVVGLVVYGTLSGDTYRYTVDPENVTIDSDNNVTFVSKTGLKFSQDSFIIR